MRPAGKRMRAHGARAFQGADAASGGAARQYTPTHPLTHQIFMRWTNVVGVGKTSRSTVTLEPDNSS